MKLSFGEAFQFSFKTPTFAFGCIMISLSLFILLMLVLFGLQGIDLSPQYLILSVPLEITLNSVMLTYFLIRAKKQVFNYSRGMSAMFFITKALTLTLAIVLFLCGEIILFSIAHIVSSLIGPIGVLLAFGGIFCFSVYLWFAFLIAYTERFNFSNFLDRLAAAFSSPLLILSIIGLSIVFSTLAGVLVFICFRLLAWLLPGASVFSMLMPVAICMIIPETRRIALFSLIFIPVAIGIVCLLPSSASMAIPGGGNIFFIMLAYLILTYLYLAVSMMLAVIAFFCHLVAQSSYYLMTGETLEMRKERELAEKEGRNSNLDRLKQEALTTNKYAKTY